MVIKKPLSRQVDATLNLKFGLCGRKFAVQKELGRQEKSIL